MSGQLPPKKRGLGEQPKPALTPEKVNDVEGKQAETKDGKDCFFLKFPKARKGERVNRKIEPASYGSIIVIIIFAVEHSGRGWPKTVFAAAILAAAGPQGLAASALATVPPRLPTPTNKDEAGPSWLQGLINVDIDLNLL
ncbi:hypothetical protein IscW_ISCW002316 [Ixodes scapularis]|uniref:Uncharacterized protein n=1 Tax=Ixodes scapularis TaxID=6945 RepID=B7PA34_IXOSC|nr:hypothetical protein IscW_ISCW002316 [Ixodes scapularis]|eukprot:XP_002406142.1 hypothetical protein IscW_ISCW002316 [Ixodes scapularis]